jgi:phosphatidylserine synthase
MEQALSIYYQIFLFLTNPSFQKSKRWVRQVGEYARIIHEHVWTSTRFFGGFIVAWIEPVYGPIIALLVFMAFAITDWLDGLVAWVKGKGETFWGSFLDGFADKVFVIPVLYAWGRQFSSDWLFWILVAIEFGGYILVKAMSALGIIEKDKEDLYKHLLVGKIKFGLQVALVFIIWIARTVNPDWYWWILIINLILANIILLAGFSVACKINEKSIGFLADFITLESLICGLLSATIAWFYGNLKLSAALVVISLGLDFADGYVARITKGKGNLIKGIFNDDGADATAFGIAPAMLIYSAGSGWILAGMYLADTWGRLAKFTRDKLRALSEKEKDLPVVSEGDSEEGKVTIFKGLPSPAAGAFIASLFLWSSPSAVDVTILSVVAVIFARLETLFDMQWYHFKHFSKMPGEVRFGMLLFFLLMIFCGRFGEGLSAIILIYLFLFSKKVADLLFHLNERVG